MIACALGQSACRQGHTVRYFRRPRFLNEELARAHADGSYENLLHHLGKTELIILTIGAWPRSVIETGHDLLEVIDDRAGRRATLITSQIPVDHWHDLIGDATFADAILDRLVHRAHRITLTGGSLRRLAPNESEPEHQT